MTPTPTPSPVTFANAQDGFASAMDLTGIIGLVATAVVILLVIAYGASSLERYDRLRWLVGRIARVFELAAKGLAGVVVLGVATAPAYFVASQPAATRNEWLTYAGYGLAVLLALAAFGWVVERIVEMLQARRDELQERRESTATEPEPSDD